MKTIRPPLRRLLAIAAVGAAGIATSLVAATPAHADPPLDPDPSVLNVEGKAGCEADGWHVVWKVSSNVPTPSLITAVSLLPSGTTVSNIIVGATIPANTDSDPELIGVQMVTGGPTVASLSVTASYTPPTGGPPVTLTGALRLPLEIACTPLFTVEQDCHGITFTFNEPQEIVPAMGSLDGTRIVLAGAMVGHHIVLDPDPSGDTVDETLIPGTTKAFTFAGVTGLVVHLAIDPEHEGFENDYPWTHAPCLPQTGSSLTGTIATGVGLLAGGIALVALVFAIRRRRTPTQG